MIICESFLIKGKIAATQTKRVNEREEERERKTVAKSEREREGQRKI